MFLDQELILCCYSYCISSVLVVVVVVVVVVLLLLFLFLFLIGATSSKKPPRLRRLKSDQDDIWQDLPATMTSIHAGKMLPPGE